MKHPYFFGVFVDSFLCVCRLFWNVNRCFCLVREGLGEQGEMSAAGEDKGEGGEEVEHGEFHRQVPLFGVTVQRSARYTMAMATSMP